MERSPCESDARARATPSLRRPVLVDPHELLHIDNGFGEGASLATSVAPTPVATRGMLPPDIFDQEKSPTRARVLCCPTVSAAFRRTSSVAPLPRPDVTLTQERASRATHVAVR